MKTQYKNRTQSAQTTLQFLQNCPSAILLIIPILTVLITALEVIINAILLADGVQATVATGAGSAREEKKSALLKMAQSAGRAILSYAANSGNVTLEKLMDEMLLEFEEKSDLVFKQRCTTILEKANENASSLIPFGVSAAVILAYTRALNDYKTKESTVNVRNLIIERANATAAIPTLLKQAARLLIKQIDPLVYSLTDEFKSFKDKYKESRRVIDLGHRYTTFKGLVKVKDNPTVLSNAELEFRNETGESFKIKTDINGKYRERIHPDIYSIYVTHPDFQPFLIEGQKILPGEMRVENFELVPRV